jgi:branched-chain amino acid transport system ATP-binding protein
MTILAIRELNAWYGLSHVVQGVSFSVNPGEVVVILGRNGAGKTTLLRTIMRLIQRRSGAIVFDGRDISNVPAYESYHLGLGYVPEQRRIVPGLSVRDNLRLGLLASRASPDESEALQEATRTFPRLSERLNQEGVTLSGGEQQMLAIARALVSKPKLLLLDEPSEGIMPVLVDEIYELFAKLKSDGLSLVLVEQDIERSLEFADHAIILDQGEVVYADRAEALRNDRVMQERYCAI